MFIKTILHHSYSGIVKALWAYKISCNDINASVRFFIITRKVWWLGTLFAFSITLRETSISNNKQDWILVGSKPHVASRIKTVFRKPAFTREFIASLSIVFITWEVTWVYYVASPISQWICFRKYQLYIFYSHFLWRAFSVEEQIEKLFLSNFKQEVLEIVNEMLDARYKIHMINDAVILLLSPLQSLNKKYFTSIVTKYISLAPSGRCSFKFRYDCSKHILLHFGKNFHVLVRVKLVHTWCGKRLMIFGVKSGRTWKWNVKEFE